MTREEDVLKKAVEGLTRQTGLKVKYDATNEKPHPFWVDAGVSLLPPQGKIRFWAEIKTRVSGADTLLPLIQKAKQHPGEYLLVTRHATEEMAERLRKNGIQFIDESGNAFINRAPLYIFVKGNKNPEGTKGPHVGRAFKQTGLKILYALLCNPGKEGQPYRTIAADAGVALGMVNWVMRELKDLGFLVEIGTGRGRIKHLIEKEKLLDRWITAYAEQLRPKLIHGRYRGDAGWWQNAELNTAKALWGGEIAAGKMTGYLKPQEITVYVEKDNPAVILIPFKLKKDPTGEVEVLYRFWQPGAVPPNADMVHPLLVYADLVITGNQRNLDTARKIYDKHIVQLIRET